MKIYTLTPDQFNALRTRLLEAGVTLPDGSQGILSFKNIDLKYNYNGSHLLTLSILKRPFLIAPSLIWAQVDSWVQGGV